MALSIFLAGLVLQSAVAAAPDENPQDREIIVTGQAEEADANASAAPLGSRIARETSVFGNAQIATTTGVAGLTPGSGMDPFEGESRRVKHRTCRSADIALSSGAACPLANVQARLAAGDHGAARSELERLLQREDLTPADRYVAWRFGYQLAMAVGDDRDREDALTALLATGLMPEGDRNAAVRTLAGRALKRGEDGQAQALLEKVVAEDLGDADSRVNLAIIYDRAGRGAEALMLVRDAIAIASASGRMVPFSWQQFADSRSD